MGKRKKMSETKEEDDNNKQKGFDLNECAPTSSTELAVSSKGKKKKPDNNLKPVGREVNITKRVLRSGSVSRDPANIDKRPVAVAEKRKGAKGGKISGGFSVVEVAEEVKHENEESSVPIETHGDGFTSLVEVRHMDERSVEEEESPVKRSRGRPQKVQQISSQLIVVKEGKTDVPCDENVDAEPLDKELKVKGKRGRPRKLQISSQSDKSASYTNCKIPTTPHLSGQLSVEGLGLKPPKNKEPADDNCKHGGTLITVDQSMSDSTHKSGRPKRKCGGRVQVPELDEDNCRERKVVRKRGRPPTPKMKRKSGETYESDPKAKKRLKLHESPLESQHNDPLIDGERRIVDVEEQNKQIVAVTQSKSESKKMLSDRILQLLLAAGWTVQYRPRNGRDYKDAVYVNPEGKTHWSVTKAYSVYKEHCESSMTGSGFGLLPEEDLQLLGRNTQNKRSDKGKPRTNWKERDSDEDMVSTKGKGRKAQKEKNQRQKKRIGSHEKFSVSVRKIKRETKHRRKHCALSNHSSLEDADSKENGFILFEGKRTMLGWMVDSAIVPLNGKLQCMNCEKTQVLLEGIVTKDGIKCNCCDEIFSALDFEVHSGGKHNQPFKSLYLEGGESLLQCFLDLWNKQTEPLRKGFHFVDFGDGDQNDDTCGVCGDGGDLTCCDGCPSTFHESCLGIKIPSGAWFCCYCSCKFCERVEAANHDAATLSPLLRCHLCEEKYHQGCIREASTVTGEKSTHPFCGNNCQELFDGLQLLIGVKHPLPEGFSWTLLRRSELSHDYISEKIAYNAKLAVAFSVMDECFSPLVDHRSGVNLLENIVYNLGSNFHRLNYSNFLTAVLERGDEIIAVASIRVHGNQLAEMPFIGTRYMYRRQGMCRRLISGIESVLGSLKVDKLVIPAVPELIDTWTAGFDFKPVVESVKKTIKNLNLLVFPGVDMLEKPLIAEPNASSSSKGYLLLAPETSPCVDVEETKPEEESKDSAHEPTADVESPAYPVDSCLKSTNAKEGDDTESDLKLLNGPLEEKKEEKRILTDKDDNDPLADNQTESNPEVADDSYPEETCTKRLEDKVPLSGEDCRGKSEDEQPDCYVIEGKGVDKKTSEVKKQIVTSRLRASSRLCRKSRTNKECTGTNAVLLDSPPQRYV
ncbi:unnamed protein product [Cochlearia groenlandica]